MQIEQVIKLQRAGTIAEKSFSPAVKLVGGSRELAQSFFRWVE